MKIIERAESFEVQSADGETLRQFQFDDNASRRAITGRMKKKQALQAARAFAGKGHSFEPRGKNDMPTREIKHPRNWTSDA